MASGGKACKPSLQISQLSLILADSLICPDFSSACGEVAFASQLAVHSLYARLCPGRQPLCCTDTCRTLCCLSVQVPGSPASSCAPPPGPLPRTSVSPASRGPASHLSPRCMPPPAARLGCLSGCLSACLPEHTLFTPAQSYKADLAPLTCSAAWPCGNAPASRQACCVWRPLPATTCPLRPDTAPGAWRQMGVDGRA